jgi:hypothetical protein
MLRVLFVLFVTVLRQGFALVIGFVMAAGAATLCVVHCALQW